MSSQFIPLTFISSEAELKKQLVNTAVFDYLSKTCPATRLTSYLEGTQYGFTASSKEQGDYKFVRITDINEGQVNWETVPYCECDSSEKYLLKSDDILVARTGGTTGKSFLVNQCPENAVFASYLIRLRLRENVDEKFIHAFLNSYGYWNQIVSLKSGSALPNVNAEKLKELKLPLCELEIQQQVVRFLDGENVPALQGAKVGVDRILHYFDDVNSLTTETTHQTRLLKALRQQVLQEAVRGELTKGWREENPAPEPTSVLLARIRAEKAELIKTGKLKKEKPLPLIAPDEVPFELPEGWVWCRLGSILEELKYGTSQKCDYDASLNTPILRIPNVSGGEVNIEDLKYTNLSDWERKELSLKQDDLLLIRSNGSGTTVGRCVHVSEEFSGYCYAGYLIRLRFFNECVNSRFVKMITDSSFVRQQIEGPLRTTVGVKNVNSSEVNMLKIPLPPLAEQAAIVAKIESLLCTVGSLEAEATRQGEVAGRLMQAVLGEVLGG